MPESDFSKYGKSFQESLAYLFLENRSFSDQLEEVLDVEFFELKYLRVFTSLIVRYKDKYKSHPTRDIMESLLRSSLDEENEGTQKQVRDFFVRYSNRDIAGEDYIKETSLDFCKKQKLKEAILKSVNLLQNSSYDEIKGLIDEALKLGIDPDLGHDYKKDFESRYEFKARNPISTNWKYIDRICKAGLGKGELGVCIAATGSGKSMALVHLGTAALKAGKNVVHYTMELSDKVIGLRYDSCLSNVPLNDLHGLKDQVHESCIAVEGELFIKEYSTKSASPQTLSKSLEKLKKLGHKVDLIIVDYADLLKPSSAFSEKRNELESIYEDLRGMAQENNCPIWTASQTNRSGLNAEIITMESISEAFSKCFVADFIFSISRTIEDKSNNTGRMFIAKNRNGPDGIVFPMFIDTASVTMRVMEQSLETPAEIEKNAVKKQHENLKEKYKKFRT
tara:strand:- start:7279 stop:8628 length:1350 start_codon:yes stop_codon:yes gene_type:complete